MLYIIRTRIVAHLAVLPIGWFRAAGSGAVKKVMTDDLEAMHQLIAHALGEIIAATVAISLGLLYLALVDWRLASAVGGTLLALFVSYRIALRSMSSHMARLYETDQRISAASVEYADGIAVVKTFSTGGRILERFNQAVRDNAQAMRAWFGETRYSSAVAYVLGAEVTLLAVVMIFGLWLFAWGQTPLADLLPFLIVALGLPTAILPAIYGSQGLRHGRLAAGNIESLLNHPGLPEPVREELPNNYDVSFDCCSFAYEGRAGAVLHKIEAVCKAGTVTALVGPSGAGKSTLASLIPRFYDVADGAIRIGDADLRSISSAHLLSKMSLVFQEIILLRDTVRENIRLGRPTAGNEEIIAAAKAARIHDVIERLPRGYDTILGDGDSGLSGGERQRLTIARAVLSNAPIVVLDEATSALDADNETAVQAALSELLIGKTVIVIAHRLSTIRTADQILVLDAGRIVERGCHDELLTINGLYARMWRAQNEETVRNDS